MLGNTVAILAISSPLYSFLASQLCSRQDNLPERQPPSHLHYPHSWEPIPYLLESEWVSQDSISRLLKAASDQISSLTIWHFGSSTKEERVVIFILSLSSTHRKIYIYIICEHYKCKHIWSLHKLMDCEYKKEGRGRAAFKRRICQAGVYKECVSDSLGRQPSILVK